MPGAIWAIVFFDFDSDYQNPLMELEVPTAAPHVWRHEGTRPLAVSPQWYVERRNERRQGLCTTVFC